MRRVAHRLTLLLTPLLLALLLSAGPTANAASGKNRKSTACQGAGTVPTSRNTSRVRHATLCLVNRERTKRGRRALKRNRTLERVATRYTKRMVSEDFFDHVAPDGSDLTHRIRRTSYLKGSWKRWSIGENIAWGMGALGTPKEIVAGWMKSPGHRRNILDRRFREAGFGVVAGVPTPGVSGPAATYTNNLGQRLRP